MTATIDDALALVVARLRGVTEFLMDRIDEASYRQRMSEVGDE